MNFEQWLEMLRPGSDFFQWLATAGTSFLLIVAAEIGDKSQLVCMSLAARHHRIWPVLLGASSAFMVLNVLAVVFGSMVAAWVPENVVALLVAVLFAVFGVHALLLHEDEEEGQVRVRRRGHSVFVTTFLLIVVAEFGDKTQLAVAGLSSTAPPVPVWLGSTLALVFTSALGIWAGRSLLQRLPLTLFHRISGVAFLLLAGAAAYHALPPLALPSLAEVREHIVPGFIASLLAGLATAVGALPLLCIKGPSENLQKLMLGFAAGVMLAATSFSLLVPSLKQGDMLWPGKGAYVVAVGMLLGILSLRYSEARLPLKRTLAGTWQQKPLAQSGYKIWLFIVAITIHNFPEGLAVGVGFGAGERHDALLLAFAVGLQNIPEGLAVALPVLALGYGRLRAAGLALLTGLVEPVGGLLGVSAVTMFEAVMPWAMGFAAGAMLYVIYFQVMAEIHKGRNQEAATLTLLGGFLLMMVLDNVIR